MSETGLSECVQQPFERYLGFYFASEQTQSLLHETRGHLARLRYVLVPPSPLTIYRVERPRGSPGRVVVPAAPSPAGVPQDCHGQGFVDLGKAQRLAA